MSKKKLKKEIQFLRDAIHIMSVEKWIYTEHIKPETCDYVKVTSKDGEKVYKAKLDIHDDKLWWFIATDKETTITLLPLKDTLWKPIEDEKN